MNEEKVHGFKKALDRHLSQCGLCTIADRVAKGYNQFHGYDIRKEQIIRMLELELEHLHLTDAERTDRLHRIKVLKKQCLEELEDMACEFVNQLPRKKLIEMRLKQNDGKTFRHAFKGIYVDLTPYLTLRGDMVLSDMEQERKKSQAKYHEISQWGAFE